MYFLTKLSSHAHTHTPIHEHPLQEELHAVGAELGAAKAERDACAVAAREQQQAAAAQVCSMPRAFVSAI